MTTTLPCGVWLPSTHPLYITTLLFTLSTFTATVAQDRDEPGRPDLCYCPCNSTGAMPPKVQDREEGLPTLLPGEEDSKLPEEWSPDQPERPPRNPFALARSQAETCMADIAFVLDASGSVTNANWAKMLTFVQDFAGRVNFGLTSNRIGVVSYANTARLDIKLNAYGSLSGFRNAVRNIPYLETSTNTAEGIRVMRTDLFNEEAGDRPSYPNIAIVMTDGESMIQPENTIPEAQGARDQGIIVFAVGIGTQLKQAELEGISNSPNSQFLYNVEDFDTLISRVDDIVNAACEVTTCTRNDIAFVLDSSGSIGATNWGKVTRFVGEFVSNLAIGPESNQVGIVTYSSQAELNLRLDEYTTRRDMMSVIQNLPWKNHRTNTSGGLRVMRQAIFNEQLGDRRDAPNIAIVMTDGYSNIDAQLTVQEAEFAKRESVRIFAIGVGDLVEMNEISAIANDPGYYYEFLLRTFDDLVMYTRRIFDVICSPMEPSPSLDFSLLVSGVLSTCMAFVMMEIGGTLMSMSFTVNASINVPIGVFFILAGAWPPANSKAVLVSSLLAFGVITWISQGALYYQYPAEFLPLTTDGCHSNVTTLNGTLNYMTTTNMTTPMDASVQQSVVPSWMNVYKISYMWYYPLGFTIGIVSGILLSLIPGFKTKDKIDERYIFPCLRGFFQNYLVQNCLVPFDEKYVDETQNDVNESCNI